MATAEHWPLFGLRVVTPRLELGYPSDDDLARLAAVPAGAIHDPAEMPFAIPWTDAPPQELPRNTLQHYWLGRASWKAQRWDLPLVARYQGEVVGVQALHAEDFPVTRQVSTGSWLLRRVQGQGLGKEMRAAVLHLAFAGLGAERALSGAYVDNPASLAVSRALGYVENGYQVDVRRGRPARRINLLLTRERWEPRRRDDIRIEGLEPCLALFGL
jgi:RimJ/RimL family protein N-acetyltransferase